LGEEEQTRVRPQKGGFAKKFVLVQDIWVDNLSTKER